MEYGQRKSASAAATDGDAKRKKLHLHITTTLRPCQILFGITSWVSFLGLLGVMLGMVVLDRADCGVVQGREVRECATTYAKPGRVRA